MMRPREARMMHGSTRFGGRAGRSARSGPRLDMAPLADVAFLLLTFFTCAVGLLRPNVIEIAVPPALACFQLPCEVLEMYVRRDGGLCYGTSSQPGIRPLTHADLVAFVIPRRSEWHYDDSRYRAAALKVDPAAKYGMVVAALDSISRMQHAMVDDSTFSDRGWAEGFTIHEMTDDELRMLNSL